MHVNWQRDDVQSSITNLTQDITGDQSPSEAFLTLPVLGMCLAIPENDPHGCVAGMLSYHLTAGHGVQLFPGDKLEWACTFSTGVSRQAPCNGCQEQL